MRPAEALLALHFGLKHTPACRQRNQDFNDKQPAKQFQRFFCRCDFFERLDRAAANLIREDTRNGISRRLEEDTDEEGDS